MSKKIPKKCTCKSHKPWRQYVGINDDICHLQLRTRESTSAAQYTLTAYQPGPTPIPDFPTNEFTTVYGAPSQYIGASSSLMYPQRTTLGSKQVMTRIFPGGYKGPGAHTRDNIELETELITGTPTSVRDCKQTYEWLEDQVFMYLPDYGNPQRVQHVVQPNMEEGGWLRGYISRNLDSTYTCEK